MTQYNIAFNTYNNDYYQQEWFDESISSGNQGSYHSYQPSIYDDQIYNERNKQYQQQIENMNNQQKLQVQHFKLSSLLLQNEIQEYQNIYRKLEQKQYSSVITSGCKFQLLNKKQKDQQLHSIYEQWCPEDITDIDINYILHDRKRHTELQYIFDSIQNQNLSMNIFVKSILYRQQQIIQQKKLKINKIQYLNNLLKQKLQLKQTNKVKLEAQIMNQYIEKQYQKILFEARQLQKQQDSSILMSQVANQISNLAFYEQNANNKQQQLNNDIKQENIFIIQQAIKLEMQEESQYLQDQIQYIKQLFYQNKQTFAILPNIYQRNKLSLLIIKVFCLFQVLLNNKHDINALLIVNYQDIESIYQIIQYLYKNINYRYSKLDNSRVINKIQNSEYNKFDYSTTENFIQFKFYGHEQQYFINYFVQANINLQLNIIVDDQQISRRMREQQFDICVCNNIHSSANCLNTQNLIFVQQYSEISQCILNSIISWQNHQLKLKNITDSKILNSIIREINRRKFVPQIKQNNEDSSQFNVQQVKLTQYQKQIDQNLYYLDQQMKKYNHQQELVQQSKHIIQDIYMPQELQKTSLQVADLINYKIVECIDSIEKEIKQFNKQQIYNEQDIENINLYQVEQSNNKGIIQDFQIEKQRIEYQFVQEQFKNKQQLINIFEDITSFDKYDIYIQTIDKNEQQKQFKRDNKMFQSSRYKLLFEFTNQQVTQVTQQSYQYQKVKNQQILSRYLQYVSDIQQVIQFEFQDIIQKYTEYNHYILQLMEQNIYDQIQKYSFYFIGENNINICEQMFGTFKYQKHSKLIKFYNHISQYNNYIYYENQRNQIKSTIFYTNIIKIFHLFSQNSNLLYQTFLRSSYKQVIEEQIDKIQKINQQKTLILSRSNILVQLIQQFINEKYRLNLSQKGARYDKRILIQSQQFQKQSIYEYNNIIIIQKHVDEEIMNFMRQKLRKTQNLIIISDDLNIQFMQYPISLVQQLDSISQLIQILNLQQEQICQIFYEQYNNYKQQLKQQAQPIQKIKSIDKNIIYNFFYNIKQKQVKQNKIGFNYIKNRAYSEQITRQKLYYLTFPKQNIVLKINLRIIDQFQQILRQIFLSLGYSKYYTLYLQNINPCVFIYIKQIERNYQQLPDEKKNTEEGLKIKQELSQLYTKMRRYHTEIIQQNYPRGNTSKRKSFGMLQTLYKKYKIKQIRIDKISEVMQKLQNNYLDDCYQLIADDYIIQDENDYIPNEIRKIMYELEREVNKEHRLAFNIEASKLLHTLNFNCNFIKSDDNRAQSADFLRWKNPDQQFNHQSALALRNPVKEPLISFSQIDQIEKAYDSQMSRFQVNLE